MQIKVSRQRKDFINKFVSSITKMNDVVCVEDLNAALNIRTWALLHIFNLAPTVGTTESHASGDMIFVGRSADEAAESLVRW